MTKWLVARKVGDLGDGKTLIQVTNDGVAIPEEGFVVRIRKPRSLRQHRLFWQMLGHVVDSTGRWPTKDALYRWVKYQMGAYQITKIRGEKHIVTLDSWDFMAMGGGAFTEIMDRAIDIIAKEVGFDPLETMGYVD